MRLFVDPARGELSAHQKALASCWNAGDVGNQLAQRRYLQSVSIPGLRAVIAAMTQTERNMVIADLILAGRHWDVPLEGAPRTGSHFEDIASDIPPCEGVDEVQECVASLMERALLLFSPDRQIMRAILESLQGMNYVRDLQELKQRLRSSDEPKAKQALSVLRAVERAIRQQEQADASETA